VQNAKPYQSYGGQLNAPTSDGQNQALNNAYLGTQGNQMQGGALNAILSGALNVNAQ
jgi:hypothetical protein